MKPSARISLLCRDLRKNARIKNRPQTGVFPGLKAVRLIYAADVFKQLPIVYGVIA